jgi:hypothetical protein
MNKKYVFLIYSMSGNPTFTPEPNSPDITNIDPSLIGIDPTITTEIIQSQSSPISFDNSNSGEFNIKQLVTIGNPELVSLLRNPNLNNDIVIPQLVVGGTFMSNDIILGSNEITHLISDNTGTYIWNDLSVSGVINNTDLQSKLNSKANGSDVYTKTQVDTSLGLKANSANPTFTGTVTGITKDMVGLGNVDNTSDASKPVSTATQTALDLKANSSDVYTKAQVIHH